MSKPFLAVKDFESFQHYKLQKKGWTPPWIKLFAALLRDYHFRQLSDASRFHLIGLWLIAAHHKNRIPYDLTYIASELSAKNAVDLDELIQHGWLIPTEHPTGTNPQTGKVLDGLEGFYKDSRTIPERVPRRGEKRRGEKRKTPNGGAARGGWVGKLGLVQKEHTKGSPNFGKIGKLCEPLVAAHGEEPVERAARRFWATEKAQYGWSYFAEHYGDFCDDPPARVIPIDTQKYMRAQGYV